MTAALVLLVASALTALRLMQARRRTARLEAGTFQGLAQALAPLGTTPVVPLRPRDGAPAPRHDIAFAIAA